MVGWDLTALTVRHFLDVKMESVWLIQILAFAKMAGKDLFAMNQIVGEIFKVVEIGIKCIPLFRALNVSNQNSRSFTQ